MNTDEAYSFSPYQKENIALKRAVEELSILNELAQAVAVSSDLNEMLNTIVKRSLLALKAEQGVITLVDENGDEPAKTLVRVVVRSSEEMKFHFHDGLLGWMLLHKQPLLLNDPHRDLQFKLLPWDESILSLLCVPMMVKGTLTGVITVYNAKGMRFSDDDRRLLTIIASQMSQMIHNYRLEEEKREMLVRIARDLHDDVASTLSSIALYAESMKRQEGSLSHQTTMFIEKMSMLSLEAVETMGDIVWSITPNQETMNDVLTRMRHYVVEVCNAKGIRCDLQFVCNDDIVPLTPDVVRNVYLIFKEAVHNVVKHSHTLSVTVNVEIKNGTLLMKIRDDGVGFSIDQVTRGNGLRNMERRAKEIHAAFSLESVKGKGTQVLLSRRMT